jgi:hypothetical protein
MVRVKTAAAVQAPTAMIGTISRPALADQFLIQVPRDLADELVRTISLSAPAHWFRESKTSSQRSNDWLLRQSSRNWTGFLVAQPAVIIMTSKATPNVIVNRCLLTCSFLVAFNWKG